MLNFVITGAFINSFVYLWINIAAKHYFLALFNLLNCILDVFTFIYNYRQKHRWVLGACLFFASASMVISSYFYNNGTEYFLIVVPVICLVVFEQKIVYFLFSSFCIVSFLFLQFAPGHYIEPPLALRNRAFINALTALIFLVVNLQFLKYLYSSYQRNLEKVNQQLAESNQAKLRLLSTVSHDLRNPVGGIAYLSELLLQQEHASLNYRESIESIRNTALSTLTLVNELLEINDQSETGNGIANTGISVNVVTVINQVTDLLQLSARKKQQQLFVETPQLPLYVSINRQKIERVLNNVVNNAIKFSYEGSAIYISLRQESEDAIIQVKDSGIGIPATLQPFIFHTSSGEAKREGTAREKSYGLGMGIAREIMEGVKGRLWFESNEGLGTTFYIQMPLQA